MRSTGLEPRSCTTLTPVAFSKAASTPARTESPHRPPQVITTIDSGLAASRRPLGRLRAAGPARAAAVLFRKSRRRISFLPSLVRFREALSRLRAKPPRYRSLAQGSTEPLRRSAVDAANHQPTA